ncbi:MAG TPA: Gfo/Idh/MocA family oxidoreductase [Opitutaceae bacterium]|nr:Gfo/Idh/MocA family oxidoreductase [Opitutaceae bacterium]
MPDHPVSSPRRLTRRDVLKRGLAGILAAGAAPLFAPARLLGQGAPSRKLNLAIIGNGLIAGSHVGTLTKRDDCRIVAVCDVWRKKAERMADRIAKEYGGDADRPAIFATHEDLLANADVDAVFVTTPDHWHAPVTCAALRAGKDVYCEKPLTLTVREGRTVVDTARRTGRIVQTGSQQRSEHAFRRAAAIIRNGWIGEVKTVKARLGHFPQWQPLGEEAVPEGLDYDRWLGPTPWRPFHSKRILGDYGGGWRIFYEYGGRKNGDWGAHHFDIIQWALGMDDSGPVDFIPMGFEGTKYQTHRYANGVTVERVDENQPAMIEFIGTHGRVRCGRNAFLETEPGGLATRALRASDVHPYESDSHHDDFFHCVRTRQRPICDAEVGHRTATICHLNNIAAQLRRPVKWDPLREEIVGDDVAARLLDRPRRAPYGVL